MKFKFEVLKVYLLRLQRFGHLTIWVCGKTKLFSDDYENKNCNFFIGKQILILIVATVSNIEK